MTEIFELTSLKQSENFLQTQCHKGVKEGNPVIPLSAVTKSNEF
ncbi:hypothetical protein HMPREF9064_0260 [Aggregatibacter segnis ATCC 33393]|uniref:Uncharacterized protein n=1 Tax=Aggregatibacter segnis ATCC 33393 TaxID=888057 RepID=E6KVS8_9PAST|nr:hypothetical protein HMPREF9064_0260 [Aggregatibacter segnis ATCC 33393]